MARELVRLGKAAVPDLEKALNSVEKLGMNSDYGWKASWLVLAYARIQGPTAAPRLRRMTRNQGLAPMRFAVDQAVALSLGLTSYITSDPGPQSDDLCKRLEPRDALNGLLYSLIQDDPALFEASLGTNSKRVLDRLLQDKSWEAFRRELWNDSRGSEGAMGYRFDVPGRWSVPQETLEEKVEYSPGSLGAAKTIVIDTRFTNRVGNDCGRQMIEFRLVDRGRPTYEIDNADIEPVLRTIASCWAN